MSKVKLTIIKDSPAALAMLPTVIIQDLGSNNARKCSEFVVDNSESKMFMFGKAAVYTHGVQAFIFEDVEE